MDFGGSDEDFDAPVPDLKTALKEEKAKKDDPNAAAQRLDVDDVVRRMLQW